MELLSSFYPVIKHFHFTSITISVLFFMIRFVLQWQQSPLMDKKIVKKAPYVVDAILLFSGLVLCIAIRQYPFIDSWVTEKLLAVGAYIFLTIIAMRTDKGRLFKIFAAVGALSWVYYAAKIAITKHALIIG